ncbi:hypothetical protein AGMMS50239_38870 [Bacteroidia bacterium]|nr:hypothetical protein AGMMS50239_38870 [Bacteroidia bacterium]
MSMSTNKSNGCLNLYDGQIEEIKELLSEINGSVNLAETDRSKWSEEYRIAYESIFGKNKCSNKKD